MLHTCEMRGLQHNTPRTRVPPTRRQNATALPRHMAQDWGAGNLGKGIPGVHLDLVLAHLARHDAGLHRQPVRHHVAARVLVLQQLCRHTRGVVCVRVCVGG